MPCLVGGGCQSSGLKKEKNVFLGGCPIKKPRKTEKKRKK